MSSKLQLDIVTIVRGGAILVKRERRLKAGMVLFAG